MTKNKQVFKGDILTYTKVKNSILKIWDLCDDSYKNDWYQEANIFCSQLALQGRLSRSKVVGIVAALSPMKRWETNKQLAIDLVNGESVGHMKAFVKKAEDILNCDGSDEQILTILNGRKISAFYMNIKYPDNSNHITIDRHALSICLGYWITDSEYQGMTASQYNFFCECFVLAANKVGVSPLLMQSTTWLKWREIKQDYKSNK